MAVKDLINNVVESAKGILHDGDHDDDAPKPEPPADAIAILKADHREVEALFETILAEKSSTLRAQRGNIEKVLAALTLHAKIEESIFYPAVYGKTKRDSDERLDVLEAFEEHASMKDLMRKIGKADARDESLKAKVQVLSEITKHHVTEEESEFFHEARELLGEKKLAAIGEEIRKIKMRAEKKASPKTTRAAAKKRTTQPAKRSIKKQKR